MALTKDLITESIQKNTDLKKAEITRTFQSVMEIMKQTLSSGEDIMISGFGKLCVKEKKKRRGRNPQTGRKMNLGARRVVTFKWSRKLKEKLNTRSKKQRKRNRNITSGKKSIAFALTEPDAGSDASAITTIAVRRGDEFVIDGRKMLITNGAIADLVTVIDLTDPENRARGRECVLEIQPSPCPGSDQGDPETSI
jgi:integration host factor subunit alpha